MILLYSPKVHKDLIRIKPSEVSLLTYAQTSRILNLEVKHIKDRLKNVYVVDEETISNLTATPPFPYYIKNDIILWEDMFITRVNGFLNWECLNILIGLSGSIIQLRYYKDILDMNMQIQQDMMYLSVQLSEISAKINAFTRKKSKFNYIDILLARQILKKKKVRSSIHRNGRLVIDLPNVKIGNDREGYIIYNNIYIYISKWGTIDGYILQFNNFSYSSFWKMQDIILHPFLFEPYYMKMPYLETSQEAYIDNLVSLAKGEPYNDLELHPVPIDNIIKDFNIYRRIWNGIRDPRLEDSMESYKKIFIKKDSNY